MVRSWDKERRRVVWEFWSLGWGREKGEQGGTASSQHGSHASRNKVWSMTDHI